MPLIFAFSRKNLKRSIQRSALMASWWRREYSTSEAEAFAAASKKRARQLGALRIRWRGVSEMMAIRKAPGVLIAPHCHLETMGVC